MTKTHDPYVFSPPTNTHWIPINFVSLFYTSIFLFPSSNYILQVPAFILAQVLGSTLANGTLRLLFTGHDDRFAGTIPTGSNMQSFVLEFIITFYLMFVISGVATDNRAVSSSPLSPFNHSLFQKCLDDRIW
jgi:glycerol uptake facilitator-like aquaporin